MPGKKPIEPTAQTDRRYDLYRKYRPLINQTAASFCRCGSEEYKDLCCELTLHMWTLFDQLSDGHDILDEKNWLGAGLFRHAIDIYRHNKLYNARTVTGLDFAQLPIADNDDNDERYQLLLQLISQLDDKDLEILFLFFQDLSPHEIAKKMGTNYVSTCRALRRIVRRLKDLSQPFKEQ